ncbi:hypothetical protein [Microlunatus soli]|uniref:hypothetical protein n=1 Tax=Microlunatus soli TaxID=630515 RepID=UPI0012FC684D|nr:hypothetical protein [Microlunatus soli]
MPGTGSLPPGENNPYLYLGGLVQATEVVARVAASNDAVSAIVDEHPGTQITVVRDPSTSGPVILITVMANSDQVAADAIDKVVAQTPVELARLQDTKSIQAKNRISVRTLTVDQQPTLEQRKRLVATGGATAGIVAVSLLLASLLDGLLMRRRRKVGNSSASDRGVDPGEQTASADDLDGARSIASPAEGEPLKAADADDESEAQQAKVLESATRRR